MPVPTKLKNIEPITDDGFYAESFLSMFNQDINKLNQLIDAYNAEIESSNPHALDSLKQIYREYQSVENKYSEDHASSYEEYRKIMHQSLYLDLQNAFKSFEIHSLRDALASEPRATTASSKSEALSEIIANMSPSKASAFLAILVQAKNQSNGNLENILLRIKHGLKNLYTPKEEGYSQFQEFLKNINVTFLGGGNSLIFKITPMNGETPFILKIGSQLGYPKQASAHLRQSDLRQIFSHESVNRQVTCPDPHRTYSMLTRSIIVTEFCEGGSLDAHSERIIDPIKRAESGLSIYTQMADILLKIESKHCAFPDMKNSNWLLDRNGCLRIADTKTLIPLPEDKKINPRFLDDQFYEARYTVGWEPPERTSDEPYSANKAHAYILGINLFQYLAQQNNFCELRPGATYYEVKTPEKFDFNLPIFQTKIGSMYKTLIQDIIYKPPEERPSVEEIQLRLCKIACLHTISKIEDLGFGPNDIEMQEYIRSLKEELEKITTVDGFKSANQRFEQQYLTLNNPATNEVKSIIANYLTRSQERFSIGMGARAKDIQEAMAKVPLRERHNILRSQLPAAKNLMILIASHRHFFRSNPVQDGNIIEQNATQTYKDLLKKLMPKLQQERDSHTEHNRDEPVDAKKPSM